MLSMPELKSLADCAKECEICSRMAPGSSVLSELNGSTSAKVMFVAEAPGRLGADRTKIPLSGDKSGDNFEHLLGSIGWTREEVFVTNAVLCNPKTVDGRNDKPTDEEIRNCNFFLSATIRLIDPVYIVSLGATALKSLSLIAPHRYELNRHCRRVLPWAGRQLIPLYHPGPRAVAQRSLLNMESDFQRLKEVIGDPLSPKMPKKKRSTRRSAKPSPPKDRDLVDVVAWLIERLQPISLFRLHKLLYLAEVESRDVMTEPFLSIFFLRQKDGPFAPEISRAVRYLQADCAGAMQTQEGPSYFLKASHEMRELPENKRLILESMVRKYGRLSNAKIKFVAYRNGPMRQIVKSQRSGKAAYNTPLFDE